MRRRAFLGAGVGTVLAGCLDEPPGADDRIQHTGTPGLDPGEALRVVEHERREQAGLYYVVGRVRNVGVEIHEFRVVVTWYDDAGAALGQSVSEEGLTVEPGRARRFDTGLFDTEGPEPPARYELDVEVA